jgi:hypothetical protein
LSEEVKTVPDIIQTVAERRFAERRIRAKISKLLKEGQGFLRGNLSERERVCGKPTCKCTRGEKHFGTYLVQSHNGKLRQLFVGAELANDVRQWVTNYQVLQELLEELSEVWWANVKKREL